MANCNKCLNKTTTCSCNKTTTSSCKTVCKENISTDCIIYNNTPNKSKLANFIGANNATSLTKILENIESKLYLPIDSCSKTKLNLGSKADISTIAVKLMQYICLMEDQKVKISSSDTKSNNLYDKIEVVGCLKKSITKDANNVEKLKIEIDYDCLKDIFPCCSGSAPASITISGNTSVCGSNTTTLTASTQNCNNMIVWSNGEQGNSIQVGPGTYTANCGGISSNSVTVISTGNCNGCVPTSVYSCTVAGNTITFRDSCNVPDENVIFDAPTITCNNNIPTITHVPIVSNALVVYAITAINSVPVINPTYVTNLNYTAVNSTIYEITCRATKNSTTCSTVRTIATGNCSAVCTGLIGCTIV